MNDPQRWADDPRAPKGAEDLLSSIEPEPHFDEVVRKRVRDQLVHATAVPMTPRLTWRAPVIGATALVLAGILIWRFQAIDEPVVELQPDVAAEVDRTVAPTTLPAASNQARVEITSEPTGAEITVDGELRGTTPLQLSLEEGTYVVQARRSGYVDARVSHRVVAGEPSRLALALARQLPPVVARVGMELDMQARAPRMRRPTMRVDREQRTGRLTINTQPWSQVYVDGRRIGNTPIVRHELPVGRHRIRFETANGVVETVTVTVREGETHRVVRRLARSPSMQRLQGVDI